MEINLEQAAPPKLNNSENILENFLDNICEIKTLVLEIQNTFEMFKPENKFIINLKESKLDSETKDYAANSIVEDLTRIINILTEQRDKLEKKETFFNNEEITFITRISLILITELDYIKYDNSFKIYTETNKIVDENLRKLNNYINHVIENSLKSYLTNVINESYDPKTNISAYIKATEFFQEKLSPFFNKFKITCEKINKTKNDECLYAALNLVCSQIIKYVHTTSVFNNKILREIIKNKYYEKNTKCKEVRNDIIKELFDCMQQRFI